MTETRCIRHYQLVKPKARVFAERLGLIGRHACLTALKNFSRVIAWWALQRKGGKSSLAQPAGFKKLKV